MFKHTFRNRGKNQGISKVFLGMSNGHLYEELFAYWFDARCLVMFAGDKMIKLGDESQTIFSPLTHIIYLEDLVGVVNKNPDLIEDL